MADPITFTPDQVRPPYVRKTTFTVDEMNAVIAPPPDPEAGFHAAKDFVNKANEALAAGFSASSGLEIDSHLNVDLDKTADNLRSGHFLEDRKQAIQGTVKAVAGGFQSLGEMSVTGVQALLSTMPGKGYVDRFAANVEGQAPDNAAARDLAQKVLKINFAPENQQEKAMMEVVNLLPEGVKAAGGTVYEKFGAGAAATTEGILTVLLLKPEIASKTLAALKPTGKAKPAAPGADFEPGKPSEGGPGGAVTTPTPKKPSPAGPPPFGGKKPPVPSDRENNPVDAAYTEMTVANPKAARALADHVREADSELAAAMDAKVEEAKSATPEQVKAIGAASVAAQAPTETLKEKAARGEVSIELVNTEGTVLEGMKPSKAAAEKPKAKDSIAAIDEQIKPFAEKEGLTSEEAKQFRALVKQRAEITFGDTKPLTEKSFKKLDKDMSVLSEPVYRVAYSDTVRNKEVYMALSDHTAGAGFNADTTVDTIMRGHNPSITAAEFYDAFSATREALRSQFGNTVKLYRATGKQKNKPVENWASTEKFAKQFGNTVVSKDVPVDNIIAVHVTRNGKYHELIVGKPPDKVSTGVVPPFLDDSIPRSERAPLLKSVEEQGRRATMTVVQGGKGKTGTGHEIGKTYRSSYWKKNYDVLGPSKQYPNGVQVRWHDTGELGEHLTAVGKDKIVGNAKDIETVSEQMAGKYPTLVESQAMEGLSNATANISKATEQPSAEDAPKEGSDDPTVYLSAGIPIKLSDLKAAFDFARTYIPGVALAEGKVTQYWEGLLRVFAPEAVGPEAKRAGAIIASRIADSGVAESMKYGPASQKRRTFWNMRSDIIDDFIKNFEKGKKFSDPVLQKAADGYRAWNKRIYEAEKGYGLRYDAIDNYLYHVFKDGDKVQKHFETKYGLRWGDPAFIKDRTFDLYEEAKAHGFVPRYTNPEDIMQARQHASDVAKQRISILAELAQHGLAIPTKKGDKGPPSGFSSVPRRAPNGDRYWVHQQANDILANLWDTKSLWSMQNMGGDIFRGAMWLKNTMVPAILSLSGFHALHVATIDNVTGMVRATKELLAGEENPAKWMARMALHGTYLYDLIQNPKAGGKINKIIKGKRKVSDLTENEITALRYMMEGGFVPLLPHVYKTGAIKSFKDAFEMAVGAIRRGDVGAATGRGIAAGWHLPFAMLQLMQKPMFEIWIPNLKTNSYLKDVATALKVDPTLLGDVGRRKETFRRLAKSVDNRYGEMAYDTLFWNRWVKDSGVAATLSLGWNLGFLREYGGAAIDTGKLAVGGSTIGGAAGGGGGKKGGGSGKNAGGFQPSQGPKGPGSAAKRGDLDKAIFITLYTLTGYAMLSFMDHMLSDEDDDENDGKFINGIIPRIGGKNADGSPRRVTAMFYSKEFLSIFKHVQTEGAAGGLSDLVLSKAAPEVGLVKAWATGVDEFDREINDPDAPLYTRIKQKLLYAYGSLEPISIASINSGLEKSGKNISLGLLGFSPAPKYITATKTEGVIRHTFQKYYGAKQTPYEKVGYSEDSAKLRKLYAEGEMQKYADEQEVVREKHQLTDKDMQRLIHSIESGEDPVQKMFKRLDWHLQKKILDDMTPEELEVYVPISNKDHLRDNYVPPEDK